MNRTLAAPAAGLVLTLAACGAPAAPVAPSPGAAGTASAAVATAAASIDAADLSATIHALAHDTMRGRLTPSPEIEKAANYLVRRFREAGLQPAGEDGTYIQRWVYDQVRLDPDQVALHVQGSDAAAPRYARDYFLIPASDGPRQGQAVYVGAADQVRALPQDARDGVLFFDLAGDEAGDEMQQSLIAAFQTAMMNGARGIVGILAPEFPAHMVDQLASAVAGQALPIPIVGLLEPAARDLVAAAGGDLGAMRAAGTARVLDATVEIRARQVTEQHTPPNVVAMLPGSDPSLRDTYVVITAHFDHVGVGAPDESGDSIFSGADDNASGTAALLAVAEAMATLPAAPARSVVFLAVSGEEAGLLGSTAWVEDPTLPLERVVANINMDMVGRNAPDTIIGIGQEYSTLQGVLEEITARHPDLGLSVIRDPAPEKMFFFRSDQLPFIQARIPAVFFTSDDHEDYHRQSDRPEKIDAEKVARVARLTLHLAHAIADNPVAPEYTRQGWTQIEEILEASPF